MTPGLFRLALASVVVINHFTPLALGTSAVAIFFVLSGYWIQVMWREKYKYTRSPYFIFAISRFWRLLPVFLVATCIAALVSPCHRPIGLEWISNLVLIGYSSLNCMMVVPAWSLDVELQFYLVAPLLVQVVVQGIVARSILVVMGIIFLVAVGFKLGPGINLIHGFVFFVFGMLAAAQAWRPPKILSLAAGGLATLFIVLLVVFPEWRSVLLIGGHPGPLSIYNPQANTAVALLLTPLAISTVFRPSNTIDRAAGELSYIVYLMHWPVMVFVRDHYYEGADNQQRLIVLAAALLLIYLGSLLILFFFDRPLNRLRASFVNGRKPGNRVNAAS